MAESGTLDAFAANIMNDPLRLQLTPKAEPTPAHSNTSPAAPSAATTAAPEGPGAGRKPRRGKGEGNTPADGSAEKTKRNKRLF